MSPAHYFDGVYGEDPEKEKVRHDLVRHVRERIAASEAAFANDAVLEATADAFMRSEEGTPDDEADARFAVLTDEELRTWICRRHPSDEYYDRLSIYRTADRATLEEVAAAHLPKEK